MFLFIVRVSKPRKIFVNFIQEKMLGKKKTYNIDNIDFSNGASNEIPIGNIEHRSLNRIRLSNFAIQPNNLEAEKRNSTVLDDGKPKTSDLDVSEIPIERKIEDKNPVLSLTNTNDDNETAL